MLHDGMDNNVITATQNAAALAEGFLIIRIGRLGKMSHANHIAIDNTQHTERSSGISQKNKILENDDDDDVSATIEADSDSNHANYDNSKGESTILQENILAYDDDDIATLKADSKQDA
eukprot:scaffold292393_cov89-Attheya_sp.AAC.2